MGAAGPAAALIKPLIDHLCIPVFQKKSEGHPAEIFIAHGSEDAPQLDSLASLSTQHDMVSISCQAVGPLKCTVEAKGAYFYRPRSDGCRIMWGLTSIVNGLALDPEKAPQKKGKWIHKLLPSWESYLEKLGLSCSLVRSQQYNLPTAAPDPLRCLPWPAVTSVGLLAVLLRFLQPSKLYGGLQSDDARQAVLSFLERLFKTMCSKAWGAQINFDLTCCMRDHPAPPSGIGQVVVQIGEDGALTWPTRRPH